MRHDLAAALIVLAALLTAADDAAALSPHVRDGWVLGLSYGGARGKAEFGEIGTEIAGQTSGKTEDGVSPQIRFGHMLGRHFGLGVAYTGWMYETGTLPIKYRYSMQNIMLAGTWYPGQADSPLGGLYLRGAAGLAWSSIAEVEIVEDEEQGTASARPTPVWASS
jgi:hypothetical protein